MGLAHLPGHPSLHIRPLSPFLVLVLVLVLIMVLGGGPPTETHHPTGSLGFVSGPYNLQLHY